jgi:excisionase family DNA binding protein
MERPINRVFKEKDTFTVAEFARRLPCSIRHAYRLVDMGKSNGGVDAYKVGERQGIRIPKAELTRFLDSRLVENLNNGMLE